jgi:hypothetical protein
VVHAPDFSSWYWIELGEPYYENREPEHRTAVEDISIIEDYNAIGRGFNLHRPSPNPFNGSVAISFNIFRPGYVNLSVFNILGRKITTLFDHQVDNIGINKLVWEPEDISSGRYYLIMHYGDSMQVRGVSYIK